MNFTPRLAPKNIVEERDMVRGHAKEQAQQKNAKKKEAMNKSGTQLGEGASKMKGACVCPICKSTCPGYKQLEEHFGTKHPKETCPSIDQVYK